MFINFVGVLEKEDKKLLDRFKQVFELCHNLNLEVNLDVNLDVFKRLNVDLMIPNIKAFHDLKIDVLRLDSPFNGFFEAFIANNKYGIKLEINAGSIGGAYLQNILNLGANKRNIRASHNFFPKKIHWY